MMFANHAARMVLGLGMLLVLSGCGEAPPPDPKAEIQQFLTKAKSDFLSERRLSPTRGELGTIDWEIKDPASAGEPLSAVVNLDIQCLLKVGSTHQPVDYVGVLVYEHHNGQWALIHEKCTATDVRSSNERTLDEEQPLDKVILRYFDKQPEPQA